MYLHRRALEVRAIVYAIGMQFCRHLFIELPGVSVRTLQQWEQGRSEPTGAAQTLIKVAIHELKALRIGVAA